MQLRSRKASSAERLSPGRQSSPPMPLKREHSNEPQQPARTNVTRKRMRVDSPAPSTAEAGDVTLVDEVEENKAGASNSLPVVHVGKPPEPGAVGAVGEPEGRAPERSEKFWYEDGSVVLRVGRVLFRLHKTVLSVQSSYFRDLFADQFRPADHFDVDAGATLPFYVISVDGLRVLDFERLLETLENPLPITRAKKSPSLDFLGAVARAAHVLKFESTHAWAKDELMDHWASKISKIPRAPTNCPDDALDALQVSLDAGIPGIRKGAFYELLRLPDFGQRDGDASILRRSDCDALIRARHLYTLAWMDILLNPPKRSKECQQREQKKGPSKCAARKNSCVLPQWLSVVESKDLRKYYVDPIAGFRALQNLDLPRESEGGFCFDCEWYWESVWKKKERRLWDELDGVLGLPDTTEDD